VSSRLNGCTKFIRTEGALRPIVLILTMLIAGILVKLDVAWFATIAVAVLCFLLAGARQGLQ
jgi:hypothetical protein